MPKTSTFNIDTLRSRIEEFCITNALIEHGDRIIIGLSGGPDSVLLTYILAELRSKHQLTLFAAHLDHGWRHESAQDAAFCRQLCASLSIPLEIEQAQNISLKKSIRGSKENLGRQLRRTFFAQLQKKIRCKQNSTSPPCRRPNRNIFNPAH